MIHHPAVEKIQTAEDLLAALRKGQDQEKPLEIGLGELKVPCRLISADEELKINVNAEQRARKENLVGIKLEVSISYAVMIDMLLAATTINGVPSPLGQMIGDKQLIRCLNSKELSSLFDQYTDLNDTINPNVQELTTEEILTIIEGIKKKSLNTRNLFSYQLRAVGKYFLDEIIPSLQMASEHGSR